MSSTPIVVFTNGCFDLLHGGHVHLLRQAASLGNHLVIGLNDDSSILRLKGPSRPLVPLSERQEILLAMDMVDEVIPFSEPTPLKLIMRIRPHILVKGGDWKISEIVGAKEVCSWGGRVVRIPLKGGFSTSQIVERTRALSTPTP